MEISHSSSQLGPVYQGGAPDVEAAEPLDPAALPSGSLSSASGHRKPVISIVHWNITSYYTNFEELKLLITENSYPECICLQETRHGVRLLRPPSKYNLIQSTKRRDNDSERGVALLINKKINYEEIQLNLNGNVEAVAARIWLGRYYTICSIYLSPSLPIHENEILELINQLRAPYLLLGDMNARHSMWGEPTENAKGKLFEKLILEQRLFLLNDHEKTHYNIQNNVSTLIDLSLTSTDAYPDFSASVLECAYGSDHHPIKIEKLSTPEIGQPSYKFKTEKADWIKFSQCTENYSKLSPDTDINVQVDHLTEFLLEAAREAIPVSMGGANNKIPLPWWNNECEAVHAERKRARRALHRTYSTANLIAVRRLNAKCRKTFKEARKTAWMKYVSSININTTLSEMWKRINKIRGKFSTHPPPLLRNQVGELTDNPPETSEIFAEAFSDVSSESNYSLRFRKFKQTSERQQLNFAEGQDPQVYNEPFTLLEFKNTLSTVKNTSAGIDCVTYSMIDKSHLSFQMELLDLYNRIYTENLFPETWRMAVTIPIPKPFKDHSSPLNFRPISLTSCLCKLLEKMINARLVWYLEKEKCISPAQSGFRRGRSTTDSLVQITSDIQQAIINKKHTVVVFYDLEKAYDRSWRRGILNSLHQFGLRGHLPIFIKNFLTNRQITVKIGTTYSETKCVAEGVPQGSVLSCSLFAVAINTAVNNLPQYVKTSLYVDDLVIYASGSSVDVAERQISRAMKQLEKWSNETGFRFSPTKTVAMHICRVQGATWCSKRNPNLSLYGEAIPCKPTHTYLGLVIDNSLRWHKHVEQLRSDCLRRLNVLKHLSHTTWGADSKSLLRIYETFIKSKLEYGVEAYGSACVSTLKKLEAIQNEALRIATGAYRTSPIRSLNILTGCKPLETSRMVKLINYVIRVIVNPSNPINEIISKESLTQEVDEEMTKIKRLSILNRCREAFHQYGVNPDIIWLEEVPPFPPWKVENVEVCANLIQHAKNSISENILKMIYTCHIDTHKHKDTMLFTDGSKSSDGVGLSVVEYQQNRITATDSRKLRRITSIFSAELCAIRLAVSRSRNCPRESVIITDSKSSIQAIMRPFSKNPLVISIQKALLENDKKVSLCWVPSHVGITGNEVADKAAKEATKRPTVMAVPVLRGDLRAHIKKITRDKWLQQWQETSEQSNKLREITDSLSPLPNSTCSNRQWERILARLRIGHSRMTHSFIMAQDPPPLCEHCQESPPLTIKHVLTECQAHRAARLRAFNRTTVTMKNLLNEGDTSPGGALHRFISDIEILNLI